ncbi:MAG: DMT family transporter [Alphaproteobacteria bacterium]|nr:DMT family transporter [Alphaproteobacteria bacterium]
MKSLAFLRNNPQGTGLVVAFFACIVYGVYPAASRAFYADGGNAVGMAVTSACLRGLCLAAWCLFRHIPMFRTAEDRKQALIGGFFQACSNLGIFFALLYIPGPLVIIIVFTHTLMLLFFMAWRGEIKLDVLNISSTVIALVGLTLVLDLWRTQPKGNWIGIGFALISAFATVSRLYVYGKQTQTRNALAVGAENFLFAAGFVALSAFFEPPALATTVTGNIHLALSCLSLVAGTFLMFIGIAKLGAFQYSLMCKMEPIFTSIFSVLLLGEVLSAHQYVGIALVLGSLAAYQICRKEAGG